MKISGDYDIYGSSLGDAIQYAIPLIRGSRVVLPPYGLSLYIYVSKQRRVEFELFWLIISVLDSGRRNKPNPA